MTNQLYQLRPATLYKNCSNNLNHDKLQALDPLPKLKRLINNPGACV